MLARACGKTNVHSLEPEDLCALTVEAAAMAKVPLAGTGYIPGVTEERTLAEIKRLLEQLVYDVRGAPGRPAPARGRGGGVGEHESLPEEPQKIRSIDAEYLSGKRFPYQEDIAWWRTSTWTPRPRARHQLAGGRPAADRGGHAGGVRPLLQLVPQDLLPDPRGPRARDRAQGADQAPPDGQLLRHPAEGVPLQVPPARSSAPGSRTAPTVGADWRPPVLAGWEAPEGH